MLRKILAVVIGIITGSIFNMAIIMVSQSVYPTPEGMDPNDVEAFKAYVATLPAGALILVLIAHAGGSFVSGLVCGLISKRAWYLAAVCLGILWTCAGVAMLMMIPAPTWFAVADTALYIPAALIGVALGGAIAGGRTPALAAE